MLAELVAAAYTCCCAGEAAGVCRSRGAAVTDVIIFGIGNDWLARAACNALLIPGVGQYLVNLNIWTHNILTLLARSRVRHAAAALTAMPASSCRPPFLFCCIPVLKMRGLGLLLSL